MILCNVLFDVKMDFTIRTRFLAGGHKTETPSSITYASVVLLESVRIVFLMAKLIDLDVMDANIEGAMKRKGLHDMRTRVWREHVGKVTVIKLAFYGIKSSGLAWISHLEENLRSMDLKIFHAANNFWYRPATKMDIQEYYKYVLVYNDDILAISTNRTDILATLDQYYMLKANSFGPPTYYLGAKIGRYTVPEDMGKSMWYMSFKSKVPSVLPSGFRPEMDALDLCGSKLAHY
jgi:hypothetical protein